MGARGLIMTDGIKEAMDTAASIRIYPATRHRQKDNVLSSRGFDLLQL
jgi:hypothetical protein